MPDALRPLRALVPLDGSGLAEAALEPAATFVSALTPVGQGAIHLVEVVPVLPVPPEEETTSEDARRRAAALQEAQAYLTLVAGQLQKEPLSQPPIEVRWSVLADTDVAGVLVHLAQRATTAQGVGSLGRFDLMAMATHGRRGLRRLVRGSFTERVLFFSRLPLLVIRPPEQGARR